MQTVIGKLVNVSERFWFFVTEDGRELKLHFEGDHDTPVEQTIALVISDEPEYEDGGYSVIPEGKYWSMMRGAQVTATNPNIKHIALIWQHRPTYDREKELRTATSWAEEMERFYRHYSRGKWDVIVKPFLWEGNCNPTPPDYCITASIVNGDDKVDFGDFKPTYYHIVSYFSNSSYCGLGNVNGNKGATYLYGGACTEHTAIHEVGHNLGLHHANTKDGGEYADVSCVMGRGPHTPGLNSPHLLKLRLEDEREVVTVNKSSQLLIGPIELPTEVLHENEYQHIIVEKDGKDKVYLSLRKDKGWPWNPKGAEHILNIHTMSSGKSVLEDTLSYREGVNTKVLPNGVKLTYHEYANEVGRISLDYDDGITPEELTLPQGFVEVFSQAELGPQHNGLWYKKDYWGQGIDLQVKDGRMAMYWYTYNNENPSRRWYYGTCNLAEGSEEFTLYTTEKGTFQDPTLAGEPIAVGKGRLYFIDNERGTFDYITDEHGRGSMDIVPIAFSQDTQSGLWYDHEKRMSGYSVQFFPHLENGKVIMYWYTYGKRQSTAERFGIETQRWFMCDGKKKSDTAYDVTIYEMQGGKFGTYTKPEPVSVGSGELTIIGDGRMSFSYEIKADSSTTGTGLEKLSRLF